MSAHPLLTRVIAKAIRAMTDGEMGEFLAIGEVAAIPLDIADRLERALDVCQRMDPDPAIGQCGETEASEVHHRDLSVWPSESFWAHPFVPLVQP